MQKSPVIYKLSGAGNTFAFVDAQRGHHYDLWEKSRLSRQSSQNPKNSSLTQTGLRKKIVRRVCSSVEGLSCDGFVFIDLKNSGWVWDFYNNDSSEAEMCGNAARCAMLFIRDILGHEIKNLELQTTSGKIYGADRSKNKINQFEITMTNPFRILKEISKTVIENQIQFSLIDTGVPHLVFEGLRLSKADSFQLRMDFDISAIGTNVTSFQETATDHISAVTYERGVEDFTLACGTGAVAAALDYWRKSSSQEPRWIQVDMPGGTLQVFCSSREKPKMRGPAEILLKAKINKDYL